MHVVVRWCVIVAAAGAMVACTSTSGAAPSSSEPASSGPSTVTLAVLASAADPNALDGPRQAVVDALEPALATHVVVSPGGCYTGLPATYGTGYVLAVWDDDEQSVRDEARQAGLEPEWVGEVTATCVD